MLGWAGRVWVWLRCHGQAWRTGRALEWPCSPTSASILVVVELLKRCGSVMEMAVVVLL